MAFTQAELDNIAAATLEFHIKGGVIDQTIQERPLSADLEKNQKTYGGGKGLELTKRVKFDRTTTLQGYTHNDTVSYGNPANLKTVRFQGKEIHSGIEVSMTELKENGIGVVDTDGDDTRRVSSQEKIALADLLEDKTSDMLEGTRDDWQLMLWADGTADAKEVAGIKSFIVDDPTALVTIGGLPQDTIPLWRNRVNLDITNGGTKIADFLQSEVRQLRRYGKKKFKHGFYAGSDFLDAIEKELRANGTYTDSGWAKNGGMDVSMSDVQFKSASIKYDPTLDDTGEAKRLYILDHEQIKLKPVEGEAWKRHTPARPHDKYVIYKAMTWTGTLACFKRNSSGVYAIV